MLPDWLTLRGAQTSASLEWAWVVARAAVVLTVAAGVLAFLGDSPVKGLILGAVGFVVAYDAALAFLIKAGRVKTAFLIGFLLDHVVLLGVWWQTLQQATDSSPNDLWLILFPVIVGGVVRVGWAVGGAYSVLLVAWMAFADIRYQAASSYPVEQLPLRAVFLVLVAALTSVLVYQLQSARRRAERESETLSAVQRSMTEALVVVDTQGVVEFCNPAAAALMGTTLDAARGRPLAEVLVGTGSDTRAEGLLEAMQGLLDAPSDAPCTAAVVMERTSAQHLTITAFPITAHKDEAAHRAADPRRDRAVGAGAAPVRLRLHRRSRAAHAAHQRDGLQRTVANALRRRGNAQRMARSHPGGIAAPELHPRRADERFTHPVRQDDAGARARRPGGAR